MRSRMEQVRIYYLVARGAYDPEQHLAEWAEAGTPQPGRDATVPPRTARVCMWLYGLGWAAFVWLLWRGF